MEDATLFGDEVWCFSYRANAGLPGYTPKIRSAKIGGNTMTANFTYLDCQKCNERTHCNDCESRLTEVLLRITGIQSADIQMARKHLSVNTKM